MFLFRHQYIFQKLVCFSNNFLLFNGSLLVEIEVFFKHLNNTQASHQLDLAEVSVDLFG